MKIANYLQNFKLIMRTKVRSMIFSIITNDVAKIELHYEVIEKISNSQEKIIITFYPSEENLINLFKIKEMNDEQEKKDYVDQTRAFF